MSDENPESDLALIARQLLEMNAKLEVLPAIQQELAETKISLRLIQGWMEGQEALMGAQAKSLASIDKILIEKGGVADGALRLVTEINQQFVGVSELAKSTFDVVTELKAQGGAHENINSKSATAR